MIPTPMTIYGPLGSPGALGPLAAMQMTPMIAGYRLMLTLTEAAMRQQQITIAQSLRQLEAMGTAYPAKPVDVCELAAAERGLDEAAKPAPARPAAPARQVAA